jgi:hypothetical protein
MATVIHNEEELFRIIDLYIMGSSPFNDLRGEALLNILEHCGEMAQLLDAMPKKGEGKLHKAVEEDNTERVKELEAKWLKRFDAFRLAQHEKSPSTKPWSRAEKMVAAIEA